MHRAQATYNVTLYAIVFCAQNYTGEKLKHFLFNAYTHKKQPVTLIRRLLRAQQRKKVSNYYKCAHSLPNSFEN